MEAKGRFKGARLVFGKCCVTIRDEELFGGGRLPLRIPWHVMNVSRYGRSARGCDDYAESLGNGWRIHQQQHETTRMDEFPRTDERQLGSSGQAYPSLFDSYSCLG